MIVELGDLEEEQEGQEGEEGEEEGYISSELSDLNSSDIEEEVEVEDQLDDEEVQRGDGEEVQEV